MKFEYFSGREPASNCYFIIPKCLNTDPELRKLSVEARYLYGLMLDRMKLSAIKNLVDKQGKTYIYYGWEEISKDIGKGRNTVFKLLEELDMESGVGLIERVKLGQGRPTRIYVMRIVEAEQEYDPEEYDFGDYDTAKKFTIRDSREKVDVSESQELNFKNTENRDSGVTDFNTQEVYEQGRINKNNINKNNYNKNLIRIYPSKSSQMDGMRSDSDETASRLYVREDLGTDHLCEMYPADEEKIRGIEDLIVDVLTSNRQKMFVGGEERETNMVKGRFMKLTESHIETVLGKWDELTKKPNNARAYLLTMLYNVSITAKAEFQARMRQDAQNNFRVDDNCDEELMEG